MTTLKEVLKTAITDREAIIYLIIENSELNISRVAKALGMSRENVRLIYEKAKEKIE